MCFWSVTFLFPYVAQGRLVFGNYLIPTTLCMNFADAHMVYTTKPASTPFDQFMHILKFKAHNTRVMLVPSPKYQGPVDEYVLLPHLR